MIGIPMDFHGPEVLGDFVSGRDLDGATHLLGNGDVWESFRVSGASTFLTITADGRVGRGFGTIPPDVLAGEFIEGDY